MHRTPRRSAVALFLALGLLVAVAPALAAPAATSEREVATVRTDGSFFDDVAAWLTGLLFGDPRPAGADSPAAFGVDRLPDLDPSAPVGSGAGPEAASDDPTADPELGPDADPHG